MRYYVCLAFCIFIFGVVTQAQDNRRPKIVGQRQVTTREDEAVLIELTDLIVRDRDDWFYPYGFTLKVYEGSNYTLSGNSVTPAANFEGMLSVTVTVNDGEDESDKYDLQVTVQGINDPPVITAQASAISTEGRNPVTIQLSHVVVSDPDNSFPSGFTLIVLPSNGGSYSVSGNQVIPAEGFVGTLSVPVQVNDGNTSSAPYSLSIEVKPLNSPPVITGQDPLTINEDESLRIQLSDLRVTDPDNNYPTGFHLNVIPGNRYTVLNNTVTPAPDFYGDLSVRITVHDGISESNPFSLQIKVTPMNDAPEVTRLEPEPLQYVIGQGPVFITKDFQIQDSDSDSLTLAEIGFLPEHYRFGIDQLSFTTTSGVKGTFDHQRGMLTLSGKAPLNEYIKAVKSITYNYIPAGSPQKEMKTIFFRLSDGKAMSSTRERQIITTDVVIKLDIPTAFTPNGDSSNDTWRIQTIKQQDEPVNVIIRVYNRFGKLLFETAGFEKEWDGRLNGEPLPADTYYYTIDFNQEYSNNVVKGIVAILR